MCIWISTDTYGYARICRDVLAFKGISAGLEKTMEATAFFPAQGSIVCGGPDTP